MDFLRVVQSVTSSVEDRTEGGGVGRLGKKEGPTGVAAELDLWNSVLMGVAVVGCEPVWDICAPVDGPDLAQAPLWKETGLSTEGQRDRGIMDSWETYLLRPCFLLSHRSNESSVQAQCLPGS